MSQETAYAALLERLRREPAAPLLTDLDLSSGDRVELSVATAANGVAKAAHLVAALAAELGAPPTIELRLPLHWQAATFALGAWGAGARIFVRGPHPHELGGQSVDAVLLGAAELEASESWPDTVWASRLHPFGLPFDVPPAYPVEDLTVALRAQPDLAPPDSGSRTSAALIVNGTEVTQGELLERAAQLADRLPPGARLLTTLPWTTVDGWVAALGVPLLGEGSVVLARNAGAPGADLSRSCASEQVAATAGVDVAGVPRIC